MADIESFLRKRFPTWSDGQRANILDAVWDFYQEYLETGNEARFRDQIYSIVTVYRMTNLGATREIYKFLKDKTGGNALDKLSPRPPKPTIVPGSGVSAPASRRPDITPRKPEFISRPKRRGEPEIVYRKPEEREYPFEKPKREGAFDPREFWRAHYEAREDAAAIRKARAEAVAAAKKAEEEGKRARAEEKAARIEEKRGRRKEIGKFPKYSFTAYKKKPEELVKTIGLIIIGLALFALIGSPWFFGALFLFGIYNLIPGVGGTLEERAKAIRDEAAREIKAIRGYGLYSATDKAELIKNLMQTAKEELEMERLIASSGVVGNFRFKEAIKIAAFLLLVFGFFNATLIPLGKFVGLIVAIGLYFQIGGQPEPEEEKK